MTQQSLLNTDRLDIVPWSPADAAAALAIFGRLEVTRWLTPAMASVDDEAGMTDTFDRWAKEDLESDFPVGHWAVRRRADDQLVGSIAVRRLPPGHEDLELASQFAPEYWGQGFATEASRGVALWAFKNSAHELFAVMRRANEPAKKLALRLGMQWVGETDKYYGLRLDVYRVRPPELTQL